MYLVYPFERQGRSVMQKKKLILTRHCRGVLSLFYIVSYIDISRPDSLGSYAPM